MTQNPPNSCPLCSISQVTKVASKPTGNESLAAPEMYELGYPGGRLEVNLATSGSLEEMAD